MTDLYIATPTQADYDALIRLAEAAGFEWASGNKMSEEPNNYLDEREETVIHLDARLHEIWYDNPRRYEDKVIETIPNLADIKAIWKVKPKYKNAFNDEKLDTSDIFKDWTLNDGVIILLENGSYDLGFEEVYKALAVEYKPKESEEVMNEKVKLPRNIINTFSEELELSKFKGLGAMTPIAIITRIDSTLGGANNEARAWCNNSNNQHKLISAVLYGYEPEPEQLYYVRMPGLTESYSYLVKRPGGDYVMGDSQGVAGYNPKFTMPEILAIDPRYKAFAVKVEEVDGNGE